MSETGGLKYPLAKDTIDRDDIDELIHWLQCYPHLTKGQLTIEFERMWADYVGSKYAVFCNSGSSANLLMAYALVAAKIATKKNCRVVLPAVAWATTIAPFIQFGFDPTLLDVDHETYGIDLNRLEDECKRNPPAAVCFVHVLGVPHDRGGLRDLRDRYGFCLLEDACAALGSKYCDRSSVGTVGDMSSFSFYFGHQLSTIEGGMVCTSDEELYRILLMLRSHGWSKDLDPSTRHDMAVKHGVDDFHDAFTFYVPGFNVRSTDLQAFLGIRQVGRADYVSARRYENHVRYARNLPSFERQNWRNDFPASISYGCLAESNDKRRRIVERLVVEGVETRIFSAGNLGRHPFWTDWAGRERFDGVISNKIHDRGFFLPNYPDLTLDDVDSISAIVNSVE